MSNRLANVYTTGQIARICQVAPRTVSKWFDAGKLKGYRIPGSMDRRIPRDSLVAFLKENNMPMEGLIGVDEFSLLTVSHPDVSSLKEHLRGWLVQSEDTPVGAGMTLATSPARVVLVSYLAGRTEARQLASRVRALKGCRVERLVYVSADDDSSPGEMLHAGYNAVVPAASSPQMLADAVTEGRRSVWDEV